MSTPSVLGIADVYTLFQSGKMAGRKASRFVLFFVMTGSRLAVNPNSG